MRFYVSKCHNTLHGMPYNPEIKTPHLCLNPYYTVRLLPGCDVSYILDSGAFQDVRGERLSFDDALRRQLDFEEAVGRPAYALVSYDRLVDEQMVDGAQTKIRVDKDTGKQYVEETVEAAAYLASRRSELGDRKLILSCQGADAEQYLGCLDSVLEIAEPGDIIGFGGFCILSRRRAYEEEFYRVFTEAIPRIRRSGINRVHIFGMGVFRALVQADLFARVHGIECSYDTSSAEMNAVFGKCFDPVAGQMSKVFSKCQENNGYRPADLAMLNIDLILNYWERIEGMPVSEHFTPSLL